MRRAPSSISATVRKLAADKSIGVSPPPAAPVQAASRNSFVVSTRSAARASTRSGSVMMIFDPAGSRAMIGSIPSARTAVSDSMPSTATPPAILSSISAALGTSSARSAARLRTESVRSSSRHGGADRRSGSSPSSAGMERWSLTENSRISSTSSPKNSTRSARSEVAGKISTIPPRTANSPRLETMSTREYASSVSRSAKSSISYSSPTASSTGSMSPSPLARGWRKARTGAMMKVSSRPGVG